MRFVNTAKAWFAALAVTVVAALPLCASIPRGYAGIGGHGSTSLSAGRSEVGVSGCPVSTDGAGRSTRYRYDVLNRRTNTVYADGTFAAFAYDACGNLLAASNVASRLAFGYDAMNRLVSSETRVAGQTFTVGYGHDLGGLCTNVVYPDGKTVRYAYDADGRVASVTDWAGHAFSFTRDAAGHLTALAYPNGVSGAWTYDANHAVSGWNYNNGSPFAGRTVTRDAAGIKTEEHVTAGLFPNPQSPRRAQNTFDAADRLVSAQVVSGTNAYAETYAYDENGALTNRQSEIGGQRSAVGDSGMTAPDG